MGCGWENLSPDFALVKVKQKYRGESWGRSSAIEPEASMLPNLEFNSQHRRINERVRKRESSWKRRKKEEKEEEEEQVVQ